MKVNTRHLWCAWRNSIKELVNKGLTPSLLLAARLPFLRLPCRQRDGCSARHAWQSAHRASPCRWLRLRDAGSAAVPSRLRHCVSPGFPWARRPAGWKEIRLMRGPRQHVAVDRLRAAMDSGAYGAPCQLSPTLPARASCAQETTWSDMSAAVPHSHTP